MKQAKVKIQNDLTGILRSPSLNHVETTSKQWLIFVLFLLHFMFDTWVSKRLLLHFLTKFFSIHNWNSSFTFKNSYWKIREILFTFKIHNAKILSFWRFFSRNNHENSWNFVYIQYTQGRNPFILTIFFSLGLSLWSAIVFPMW